MKYIMKARPVYWIVLAAVFIITISGYIISQITIYSTPHHVYDFAGVLPKQDIPQFERYMNYIMSESDVDIRFVFLKRAGNKSIEQLAVDWMDKLRIGSKTGEERGLLLLYDTESRRLKVEVGYGLEEYFPDSFIGYLVRCHAKMFFESDKKSLGLLFLLRMLQIRIREAVLGDTFDPCVLEQIPNAGTLSGGAGAITTIRGATGQKPVKTQLTENAKRFYVAQNSPAETYRRYLNWLSQPIYDPNVQLFTENTRNYLSAIPFTRPYLDFILFGEYNKQYRIVERGNLAILYFTNTPFASPHLFVKTDGKWQIDIMAEIQNTKEVTGGIYSWTFMGQGNPYSDTFADLIINIHGYGRVRNGDNRALIIRGTKGL